VAMPPDTYTLNEESKKSESLEMLRQFYTLFSEILRRLAILLGFIY
jgi:hypothetical protein